MPHQQSLWKHLLLLLLLTHMKNEERDVATFDVPGAYLATQNWHISRRVHVLTPRDLHRAAPEQEGACFAGPRVGWLGVW